MGYKSDIEIAQECEMLPITQIAQKAGIDDKYLEQYGKYKAKIDYNLLKESDKKDGKLILVTAINPTPAGEGKTTTTVENLSTIKPGRKSASPKITRQLEVSVTFLRYSHASRTLFSKNSSSITVFSSLERRRTTILEFVLINPFPSGYPSKS